MDSQPIREVLLTYFDASYEADGEKMAKVFFDPAHIYGQNSDGSLCDMSKEFFVNVVYGPGCERVEHPRFDEIISIDFTGENTAVARVKVRVGNILYTDILSFIKLDGAWGIISKVYSGETIR